MQSYFDQQRESQPNYHLLAPTERNQQCTTFVFRGTEEAGIDEASKIEGRSPKTVSDNIKREQHREATLQSLKAERAAHDACDDANDRQQKNEGKESMGSWGKSPSSGVKEREID